MQRNDPGGGLGQDGSSADDAGHQPWGGTVVGVRIESPASTAAALALSLAVASLPWIKVRGWAWMAGGAVMIGFATFDLREWLQHDGGAVAAIALTLLVVHAGLGVWCTLPQRPKRVFPAAAPAGP